MSVTYTNTRWDSVRLHLHHSLRHWLNWCLNTGMALFLVWLSSSSFAGRPFTAGTAVALCVLFLIFFIGIWMFVLVVGALLVLFNRNPGFFTEHVLTIAPEGFTEVTSVNRTEHSWIGVQKIARSSDHLLIYIASNHAHVVPRRAFPSDAEWNEFCRQCEQFAAAA
jgi:hypothetical protein